MSLVLWGIVAFLVLYQVKHLLVDYVLQGEWMLQKFREDWGFFFPLSAHASLHAFFTFWLVALFTWSHDWSWCFWMAGLDLVLHFAMDRLKAGPKYLGRYKPLTAPEWERFDELRYEGPIEAKDYARRKIRDNRFFWWSLGLDQMVHHLTHYLVVFLTVARW